MAYRPTAATRAAREQRTRSLLAVAREIVAVEGFAAASSKAIAVRAGVSVGTLYTYFANRDELLATVFRETAEVELTAVRRAVEAVPPEGETAADRLTAVVTTFASRAIRSRRLAWALLVEPVSPLIDAERLYFRRAYADTLAQIVASGVQEGELPEQDARIVGPGLVGAIGEAMSGPLSPLDGAGMSREEVVAGITLLCLRAVGSRPGDPPTQFEGEVE